MEWAEIKRRLTKEGTSVQVLADLEAVPYKTMYNRIMAHQVKDGVTYLTPENTKGMKKAKAISETKQKQAKEKEKAAGLPEPGKMNVDISKYNCATCANVIARPESYSSADGHIEMEKYCTKGHDYGGSHKCCSEYVTAALEPFIKAQKDAPEKSPDLPEEAESEYNRKLKKAAAASVAASINGVNLCNNCKMCQKDPAPFCKKFRYKLDGIVDYCSGYVSGAPEVSNAGYEIQPETIEELNQLYFQCKQLAEKYQKQAEDWRRIMEACASWSNAKEGAKIPEVQ